MDKIEFCLKMSQYNMKPIKEEDLSFLLEWRNSNRIHSMMLTEHKITWEEHKKWFYKIENTERPLHFTFFYQNKPIGYIGYNDIDWNSSICYPSLYIGSEEKVKANAGIALGKLTLKYAFEYLKMNKVCAYVLDENQRVCELNKFIGYKNEGYLREHFKKNDKYINIVVQSILRKEWLEAN